MSDVAIGVGLGPFHEGLPAPEDLFRYVERADELGIDSVWFPDHPISERPALDPSVLQSVVAARTTDLKMGPSVLTLPARNPIEVASTYADLDYLTGGRGRVIMAVGLGADPRLTDAVGVPSGERPARLREGVELLRLLWTEEDVTYEGEYYQVEDVTVSPKPAGGALDVWIGGNSDAALRRVAAYGDGWFPASMPPAEFREKQDRLMDYCEAEGRVVERDEAGVILRTHVDPDPERAREVRDRAHERRGGGLSVEAFDERTAFGTAADCVETIRRYVDAGCRKFVLMPAGARDERLEQLERYAADVVPAFSG